MEITQQNFEEKFLEIKSNLQKSCFVGYDAEFSTMPNELNIMFDTNEVRYEKLKHYVPDMMITQVGLTMFLYERSSDTYKAVGYTFHLSPQQIDSIDQEFKFSASTLKFLCMHKFNFNKFIYEGIPYLNRNEEEQIQLSIKDNTLFNNVAGNLLIEEEKKLQSYYTDVFRWINDTDDPTFYIDEKDPILRYVIHKELRNRYPYILTTDSLGESNKILLYRNKDIEGATNASNSELDEKLLNHLRGFSRVVSLLEQYKKPIVGHNIFMDIMLFHYQFIGRLPPKYATFKNIINNFLPALYDTKFISNEMRLMLSFDECWRSNNLQDLYEFFYENKCKKLTMLGLNEIELDTEFKSTQSYHEAGWDSYITGYCFLRLGHWAACENSGRKKPVGPTELLAALSKYSNKVNIMRSFVPYMNLDGDDPRPTKNLLHVRCLTGSHINVIHIANLFSNFGGSVDVKPHGNNAAVVAFLRHSSMNKILKHFKNNREYKVTRYNIYKHSLPGRMAIWSSAVLTGSILLYFLHRNIKN